VVKAVNRHRANTAQAAQRVASKRRRAAIPEGATATCRTTSIATRRLQRENHTRSTAPTGESVQAAPCQPGAGYNPDWIQAPRHRSKKAAPTAGNASPEARKEDHPPRSKVPVRTKRSATPIKPTAEPKEARTKKSKGGRAPSPAVRCRSSIKTPARLSAIKVMAPTRDKASCTKSAVAPEERNNNRKLKRRARVPASSRSAPFWTRGTLTKNRRIHQEVQPSRLEPTPQGGAQPPSEEVMTPA
jgi:hypothetical protein